MPKSSAEKQSAGPPRRPSTPRRTSSHDKKAVSSSSSSKHGLTSQSGHASAERAAAKMPDATTGATVHNTGGQDSAFEDDESGRQKSKFRNKAEIGSVKVAQEHPQGAVVSEIEDRRPPDMSDLSQEATKANKSSQEEIERLRNAVNAQMKLSQQREKLTHLIEREKLTSPPQMVGGKIRVSPINEEANQSTPGNAEHATPIPSGLETTSTESVKTIRGGFTPALGHSQTPSYPFPPMKTPRQLSFGGHRPFTALSPTVTPTNYGANSTFQGPRDRMMSGSATPSSAATFLPSETFRTGADTEFQSPNLYDLSLLLSAEPGLDPWWTTVVSVMRDCYKADRVTLAVPADSTDIENVPWGQKATYNVVEDDDLSLTYLQRGSSMVPSSDGTNETSNSENMNPSESSPPFSVQLESLRPGLPNRHSYTAFEDTKKGPTSAPDGGRSSGMRREPLSRSKSYVYGRVERAPRSGTLQNAELTLQSLEEHLHLEDSDASPDWEATAASIRDTRGRVFPVLQALDYEVDPLIDSSGVIRVLERGKLVALTRDYPYLGAQENEGSGGSKSSQRSRSSQRNNKTETLSNEKSKKAKPELASRMSSFLGSSKGSRRSSHSARSQTREKGKSLPDASHSHDEDTMASASRYEEYEQAPPSPWSHSPAPSPAVRADPNDNPFFADAVVDEESFNPTGTIPDYSNVNAVEAIGVDRSCTVLHIPLSHVLLSKPVQSFRLDAAAMEFKAGSAARGLQTQKPSEASKIQSTAKTPEKPRPIAILSIISPIIPYPSNLRHSLEHLAPHLATSFSLCRHYTNLETEIAGLSRRGPQTTGFGALPPPGRLGEPQRNMGEFSYFSSEDPGHQRSMGGSMTSPSEYSGLSRSTAGSPGGTPGYDPISFGLSVERRSGGGSPGYVSGESYFSKSRPGLGRAQTGSATSISSARDSSVKDKSLAEARQAQRAEEQIAIEADRRENPDMAKSSSESLFEDTSIAMPSSKQPRADRLQPDTSKEPSEVRDASSINQSGDSLSSSRRLARGSSTQAGNRSDRAHTQLHSYGADFAATFQSLPTTTVAPERSGATQNQPLPQPIRSSSLSTPFEMPPPSDRLKTLMLDSLPAHLFVALPQTGEIVWVNSRYLTYRGQTVSELRKDPFGNVHEDERDEFIKNWAHAVRTGEQFSMQVRIRRFDGNFRWFYTRAVGGRDTRGVIVQWYGSYMDIHDQHIAELKAARQEEVEASEAKHRLLANLIPQIIFAATEDEGVTFANEQWLSYTGQEFDDALGLGFIDYVHPEDLAKCRIPTDVLPIPTVKTKKREGPSRLPSQSSSGGKSSSTSEKSSTVSEAPTEATVKGMHQALSRHNSSSSESVYELPTADLSELARSGVIKISTDANGRSSYTTEVRLRSKTGEYRWHLVRCVEIDNINFGSGDGSWFGACTDINDQKLLETKLKEAMESKSKFLSNMSHEIRTPIIGISGMVSFLQDTVLNDEQLDYTNTIQTSASGLLSIINDILDLSKVDAGMMKLSYEWFHARSVIEEVNELVSTMAISKRLELNYVVDEDVPPMVKGDRVRIRQVLLNVIGNAIKFTSEGEVFSRCRVSQDESETVGENEILLEFSIVDTGTGFTKEEAELIFKPFSQIDGSSSRQHGGSGLGLVISRQLVELHGGKMHGSAVPGVGSTFIFTAKFGLPTETDHPEPPNTPMFSKPTSARSSVSTEVTARAIKSAGGNPIAAYKYMPSPPPISPRTDLGLESPAIASSGSSDPSIHSFRTLLTERSSASSVNTSLAPFGEAARASGENLMMKLAIPEKISPGRTPTQEIPLPFRQAASRESSDLKQFRPPMYSILIVCPQKHSREATTKHIEMTVPPDVPYQITALGNVLESQRMIGGNDPVIFTHIVLNLNLAEEVVALIDQIFRSGSLPQASIVVLSDPVQRQAVMKIATDYDHDQHALDDRVTFIYKPVKPSRFAVIFDPGKERDLSTDRNRFTAQQHVADQKQNYLDVEKRLGNKGLRVLLVEDNLVNQKVLLKFLSKVGISVDMALDGVECTEKVFAKPHNFYSLILCDLHMPRKDGYQTCRDIRSWEKTNKFSRMPIIALSANVMADVLDKCVAAGFNSYVTKPVDFKALSTAMSDLLDPVDLNGPQGTILPVE